MKGKLVIVNSCPGYRDTIYIGVVETIDDGWICLAKAANIVRFQSVGLAGLADKPEGATRVRSGGSRRVWLPTSAISVIIEADPVKWAELLEAGHRE